MKNNIFVIRRCGSPQASPIIDRRCENFRYLLSNGHEYMQSDNQYHNLSEIYQF